MSDRRVRIEDFDRAHARTIAALCRAERWDSWGDPDAVERAFSRSALRPWSLFEDRIPRDRQ